MSSVEQQKEYECAPPKSNADSEQRKFPSLRCDDKDPVLQKQKKNERKNADAKRNPRERGKS